MTSTNTLLINQESGKSIVAESVGEDEQGFALVIAHYNYTLRFRSCGPKASLGEPEGVTLSLHPPLMGICPQDP